MLIQPNNRFVQKIANLLAVLATIGMLFIMPAKALETPLDSDSDGLSDIDEVQVYFTDPTTPDTDGDAFYDGYEVENGYSPRHAWKRLIDVDSDSDYLNDAWELALGTGLMNPDSDGDMFLDGTEVAASFDPLDINPVKREKLISVSTENLRLTYTFGDTVMGEIPVSTGKSSTPTPKGEFKILDKLPLAWYSGPTWYYPETKWNMLFTRQNGWGYYIHGAYWHDKFGREPVSGGCVNVRYEDMEPLYWWAQYGTKVVIN
jgi:hypothetical protein